MNKKFTYFHNILFTKVRDVKSPSRGTAQSAGIDFYLPQIDQAFIRDFMKKNESNQCILSPEYIQILPGERCLIPSGIKVWMENPETVLIAANKSGIASRYGLIFMAQVVDSDYTGEIHLGVYNTSKYIVTIYPGEKVLQFLHLPVIFSDMKEMSAEEYELYTSNFIDSERGEGGFGSTNEKEIAGEDPSQMELPFPEDDQEKMNNYGC